MERLMILAGRLAGALGIVLVLAALGARVLGYFWVGGLQTGTLLLGGIGALVVGVFLLLVALTSRSTSR
jgi:hypothetical protein